MRWKKLIVRNLPFDATRAEAVGLCGLTEVQAACPAFYRFEAGKPTKNGMPAMPARLYLQFRKDPDELLKVLAALNGKAVESSSGVAAVLEAAVAPNQKLPREKRRRDNKVNTYERDPEFVVFLEELENPTVPEPMVGDGDDAEAKPVPALVKFLNERRSKAKVLIPHDAQDIHPHTWGVS
ncbi:hypothetical protein SPRG_08338 [Saprolegnia parasitica CBS 223.65]|uniref:UPF3 domain-containing protein n=1 Tax=Saprolegnia parasitica (strain CBS 223.65) TaxID=695850 RepID=A0A067CHI8_SAPPC|nr:hypothetical protein SPRG_08338 [Saprolegnia parasitica CBS 223.65]KDO26262.1 hypothetical protein SPRG_08338 [Saprolegnia parasitica CBS 223.65]|eukprot:XP_012202971.1 hypothetical protein SPRG_08338 [Saprolegnia parasitica CBS 223.65]